MVVVAEPDPTMSALWRPVLITLWNRKGVMSSGIVDLSFIIMRGLSRLRGATSMLVLVVGLDCLRGYLGPGVLEGLQAFRCCA